MTSGCNVAEPDLAAVASAAPKAFGDDRGPGVSDYNEAGARHVDLVRDYARHHFGTEAVVISAQIESELVDLSEEEAMEYLRGIGVDDSGAHALIRAVYHLL